MYAEVNSLTPMYRQRALTELSCLLERKTSETGKGKFREHKAEQWECEFDLN